jgi:hypothetical protein
MIRVEVRMSPVPCLLVASALPAPPARRWAATRSRLAAVALGCALGLLSPIGLAAAADAAAPTAAKKPEASPSKKAKKGKKAKPATPSQQMAALLMEKTDAVQDCAGKNALDKGANRVSIDAKVTVNNRGQVIDIKTQVTIDKGDSTPVRECVETLIKNIKFPSGEAPLVTVERNWTIAAS